MYLLKFRTTDARHPVDRYILHTGVTRLHFSVRGGITGIYGDNEIRYLSTDLQLNQIPYNQFLQLSTTDNENSIKLQFIKCGFVYRVKYNNDYLYDNWGPICIGQAKLKPFGCPRYLNLYIPMTGLSIF